MYATDGKKSIVYSLRVTNLSYNTNIVGLHKFLLSYYDRYDDFTIVKRITIVNIVILLLLFFLTE